MELHQQRIMLGKFSVGYEEHSNKSKIVTTEPSPAQSRTLNIIIIVYNILTQYIILSPMEEDLTEGFSPGLVFKIPFISQ